ncbi:uncharacterized protein EDB93DRAFT_1105533 [Suillus bovinus]|uniref:uncharacterized protein n=1 Tax=Suillus bovinus TaxID=48563 RepID=UPI001B880D6D|nr:uncharacterized protein EDB93DRAFT_1105533 [Suillus bovinus]KAG2142287.1 hypothetical protein EDB93DRAFT_1105533 [Suillus bovinus]
MSFSNNMFRNFEKISHQEHEIPLQLGRHNSQFVSQHVDDGVERDELSDGSEYNPKPRYNNHPTIKKPKVYNFRRNKLKLDRTKRAMVRALAKRGKWHHKDIATVFRVSLPLIKRVIANGYTTIPDEVLEDANFYKQSDLEELILELEKLILQELPPATDKQKKRKIQVIISHDVIARFSLLVNSLGQNVCEIHKEICSCRFPFCISSYGGRTGSKCNMQPIQDVPRRSDTCSWGKGPFYSQGNWD